MNGNEMPKKFGLISRVNNPIRMMLRLNLFSKHTPSAPFFHKQFKGNL